ncbi:MAG: dienelactone hydrolase family protein [Gammaproteobacteria bacterium]
MHNEAIEYQANGVNLKGHIAYDPNQSGKRPAVLVVHDWSGCSEFAQQAAQRIAQLGYIGFAVDMYGEGKIVSSIDEKMELMQPLLDDRPQLLSRMQAALQTITGFEQTDTNKIASMGFCFGGLCSLDLARSGADIIGAVSFHGALTPPPADNAEIKAKILVLHGYDDPMIHPTQVTAFIDEMKQAKTDWQVHNYGNTQHAFTNPQANMPDMGIIYNPLSAQRSWQSMENFFTEIFAE